MQEDVKFIRMYFGRKKEERIHTWMVEASKSRGKCKCSQMSGKFVGERLLGHLHSTEKWSPCMYVYMYVEMFDLYRTLK